MAYEDRGTKYCINFEHSKYILHTNKCYIGEFNRYLWYFILTTFSYFTTNNETVLFYDKVISIFENHRVTIATKYLQNWWLDKNTIRVFLRWQENVINQNILTWWKIALEVPTSASKTANTTLQSQTHLTREYPTRGATRPSLKLLTPQNIPNSSCAREIFRTCRKARNKTVL